MPSYVLGGIVDKALEDQWSERDQADDLNFVDLVPENVPNLVLDYDAEAIQPTVAVATWPNRGTLGTDGNAVAVGAAQPTLVPGFLHGIPVVLFNGVANSMQLTNANLLALLKNVPAATMFAVIMPTALPIAEQEVIYFSTGTSAGATRASIATSRGGTNYAAVARTADADAAAAALGPVDDQRWHVFSALFNYVGNLISLYTDGGASATQAPVSSGNTSNTASLAANIGSDNNASAFFQGYIARILVFNRLLTTAERKRIEGELGAKYSVPIIP